MQFKLKAQSRVQTQPTYIHSIDNTLIVSYADFYYEMYKDTELYMLKEKIPAAVCGYNISTKLCLLGLENGNGVCIRLDTEKPEFIIQEWRDKNYSFINSTAIVHIGKINTKQLIAVHEDGTILILESTNEYEYEKVTKFKLQFPISQCYIDEHHAIIASEETLFSINASQISSIIDWNIDKIKMISESQIKLFGLRRSEYDDIWQQQCQIIGCIVKLLLHSDRLYLITERGYFYILLIDKNSFEIERVVHLDHNKPLQLNKMSDNSLHISFYGSQLLVYNLTTKVISQILQVKSDKQLIGSYIEDKDNILKILVIYRNKFTNYQELNPPKFCDATVKLIYSD